MNGAISLVLASASPRRRRLIGWLGVNVTCIAANIAEDVTAPLPPDELALSLAAKKARAAAAELQAPSSAHAGDSTERNSGTESPASGTIILAFDTIVVAGGRVLGKPSDEADARRMLATLSGDVHEVVTGIAVLEQRYDTDISCYNPRPDQPLTFAITTPVQMRTLDEGTVAAWIARGEYLGCAGAYNIEHHLASVAEDQCYQNVAGLPLCHLYRILASLTEQQRGTTLPGLTPPVAPCNAALNRTCSLGPGVCGI